MKLPLPNAKGRWLFHPSIDDVRDLQRTLGVPDTHIIWFGPTEFVMAHTDEERAVCETLEECKLHQWLVSLSAPPVEPGYYRADPGPDHDPTSQSFRSDAMPWIFTSIPSEQIEAAR